VPVLPPANHSSRDDLENLLHRPPPRIENRRMLARSDASGDTCWSLVQRAAAGDGPSRSQFGRSYLPLIRSFLAGRWRGTPLAAELDDAVQDVFVECYRPGGPLANADPQRGDFRGFLFGIVRNVALRIEARPRPTPGQAMDAASLPDHADGEPSVSRHFDREWARALMREAGDLMRQRAADDAARLRVELLRLRFGSDLPIREIAARWTMDVDAVHRAYARARDEFHHCLRQVVAFHAVRTEADLEHECRRLFALLA
jgi:RNA polymerase sigma factor (sigma-70 family)